MGRPKGRVIVHGTNTGYNYKCRCELCKKAHAEANYPHVKAAGYKYYRPEKQKRVLLAAKIREAKEAEPEYKFVTRSKRR